MALFNKVVALVTEQNQQNIKLISRMKEVVSQLIQEIGTPDILDRFNLMTEKDWLNVYQRLAKEIEPHNWHDWDVYFVRMLNDTDTSLVKMLLEEMKTHSPAGLKEEPKPSPMSHQDLIQFYQILFEELGLIKPIEIEDISHNKTETLIDISSVLAELGILPPYGSEARDKINNLNLFFISFVHELARIFPRV